VTFPSALRWTRPAGVPSPRSPGPPADRADARLLLGWLAGLTVSEILLLVSVPAAAAGFAILGLVLCLRTALDNRAPAVRLPAVLAAVAVVRLVCVAVPGAGLPPLSRAAVIAVPVLVAVLLAARGRPAEWRLLRPGPGGWGVQGLVVLAGLPLGGLVALAAPDAVPAATGLALPAAAVLAAAAVIPEELLYRGLLVPASVSVLGRAGVAVATAGYAAGFAGWASIPVLGVAVATGLVLGWLRDRTGSTVGVVGARMVAAVLALLGAATLHS